jgi:hypothetical protein
MLKSCRWSARCLALLAVLGGLCTIVAPSSAQEPGKITHSFLATGGETFIVDGDGKMTWSYPKSTRDGWVLPSGNILLALSSR